MVVLMLCLWTISYGCAYGCAYALWLCWVKVVLHTQFQLERMESSENVAWKWFWKSPAVVCRQLWETCYSVARVGCVHNVCDGGPAQARGLLLRILLSNSFRQIWRIIWTKSTLMICLTVKYMYYAFPASGSSNPQLYAIFTHFKCLVLFCHFAGPPVLVFNAIFKIRIIFPNLVFSLKICFCGTLYCVKIYGVDKFAPGIE